jgi:hypothetical protein
LILPAHTLRVVADDLVPEQLGKNQRTRGVQGNDAFAKMYLPYVRRKFAAGQNRVAASMVCFFLACGRRASIAAQFVR